MDNQRFYFKKHLYSWLLIAILSSMVAKGNERNEGLSEIWQELYVYAVWDKQWTTTILYDRYRHVNYGYYGWFVQGNLKYRFNRVIALEMLYRQEYYRLGKVWAAERRSALRFGLSKQFGQWTIRNRHRFEWRNFEYGPNQFRYRADVKLKPEWAFSVLKVKPYFLEEAFISQGNFNRLRSYLGIEGTFKRLQPCFYFLVQTNTMTDKWNHQFIGGFSLGLDVGK